MGEPVHHFIFRRKEIGDVTQTLVKGADRKAARAKAVAIKPQSKTAAA